MPPTHSKYCDVLCVMCFTKIQGCKWDGKSDAFVYDKNLAIPLSGKSKAAVYWREHFTTQTAWPGKIICSKCRKFIERNMVDSTKIYPAFTKSFRYERCPKLDDKKFDCLICLIGSGKLVPEKRTTSVPEALQLKFPKSDTVEVREAIKYIQILYDTPF